jgi:hypothetical protein
MNAARVGSLLGRIGVDAGDNPRIKAGGGHDAITGIAGRLMAR